MKCCACLFSFFRKSSDSEVSDNEVATVDSYRSVVSSGKSSSRSQRALKKGGLPKAIMSVNQAPEPYDDCRFADLYIDFLKLKAFVFSHLFMRKLSEEENALFFAIANSQDPVTDIHQQLWLARFALEIIARNDYAKIVALIRCCNIDAMTFGELSVLKNIKNLNQMTRCTNVYLVYRFQAYFCVAITNEESVLENQKHLNFGR